MIKKVATTKSVKAQSKLKLTQQDHGPQLQPELSAKQISSQISRLEHMIIQEMQTRLEGEKQMLSKIAHLELTKKSKLPSKPELSNFNKLISPVKQNKHVDQDKSISQCRSLLTNIKSERQLELTNFRFKMAQIQKEIGNLNGNMSQGFAQINRSFQDIHSNHSQNLCRIDQKIAKLEQENATLKKVIEQSMSRVQNELNWKLEKGLEHARLAQDALIEIINKRAEQRLSVSQNCIKTCIETLNQVSHSANLQFEALDEKIQRARESIMETKQTIEQTVYGCSSRSREKLESVSSIELPSANTAAPRYMSEAVEKVGYVESRVQSLERRMDAIYGQYLSRPFQKIGGE